MNNYFVIRTDLCRDEGFDDNKSLPLFVRNAAEEIDLSNKYALCTREIL